MNILVIDDNPINRRLLRATLEAEGESVVTAGDGIEALAVLEREPVDAIVSDLLMPRMDGLRFCSEVRADPRLRLLPLIVYSANYSSPEDEQLALSLGADKFILKPAPTAVLIAALNEVTTEERFRRPRQIESPPGPELQKEFSERLVLRLEKKNEELLERAQQMHAAQERLRHLLAHSPAVLYTLRIDGDIVTPVVVSENIQRLLGIPGEATSFEWWRESLHPNDRDRALAYLAKALTGAAYSTEYRLRHQDRTYRWVEDNTRLVRDAQGEPRELVGVWTDVTERKRLEGELAQAQKMESLGRLAGGVAHDFNNLLQVIGGYTELLRDRLGGDPRLQGFAEQVLKATERASGLTRQLLAFSRRQVLQPRVLDLNQVVADVEKMLQRVIGEDVKLVTALGTGLAAVVADAGQLEQVLMNLAVNARDAMPHGGRLAIATSQVEVDESAAAPRKGMRAGRFVMLAIRDSGSGMTADVRAHIFEPFFTTKEPGKGTGLGLSTVLGIVEQSGGFIMVDSVPGEGTSFEIYLPVAQSAAAPAVQVPEGTPLPQGTETVLVVEDEAALRELVRRLLAGNGYTVLEAADAEAALEMCAGRVDPIHLLLTDVVLPGEGGPVLAQRLLSQLPGLKVLYMSGYTDDAVVIRGALTGDMPFLEKPFSGRRLLLKVREVLDS